MYYTSIFSAYVYTTIITLMSPYLFNSGSLFFMHEKNILLRKRVIKKRKALSILFVPSQRCTFPASYREKWRMRFSHSVIKIIPHRILGILTEFPPIAKGQERQNDHH